MLRARRDKLVGLLRSKQRRCEQQFVFCFVCSFVLRVVLAFVRFVGVFCQRKGMVARRVDGVGVHRDIIGATLWAKSLWT